MAGTDSDPLTFAIDPNQYYTRFDKNDFSYSAPAFFQKQTSDISFGISRPVRQQGLTAFPAGCSMTVLNPCLPFSSLFSMSLSTLVLFPLSGKPHILSQFPRNPNPLN